MSKIADIKSEIKSNLESVEGIGIVHSRPRYANNMIDSIKMYQSDDLINGIHFQQVSRITDESEEVEIKRKFEFILLYGIVDDENSDAALDLLIENICDAFSNTDLKGTVRECSAMDMTDKGELQDGETANVLCHRVIFELITIEDI